LMVCGSYLFKEKEWRDQIPKIAIYLDGYQFHASEENNIFENDIRIRKAIIAQPEFKTWSLTWTDLDYFQKQLEGDKVNYDDVAILFKNNFGNNYEKLLHTIQKGEKLNYSLSLNSVERLLTQMLYPPVEDNKQAWYSFLGSWTKKLLDPSFNPSQLSKLVSKELLYDSYIISNKIKDFNALLPVENDFMPSFLEWNTWVNIGKNNVINQLNLGKINTIDKKEWETFWRLYNLFQSDNFIEVENEDMELTESDERWMESIWDLYEDHLHPIIQLALNKGIITASNAEFLDTWIDADTGDVLADAELIFSEIKIAINPSSSESNNILLKAGFTIYDDENFKNIKL
jgi:DEAD/DEAH box helicase domain-containing protein